MTCAGRGGDGAYPSLLLDCCNVLVSELPQWGEASAQVQPTLVPGADVESRWQVPPLAHPSHPAPPRPPCALAWTPTTASTFCLVGAGGATCSSPLSAPGASQPAAAPAPAPPPSASAPPPLPGRPVRPSSARQATAARKPRKKGTSGPRRCMVWWPWCRECIRVATIRCKESVRPPGAGRAGSKRRKGEVGPSNKGAKPTLHAQHMVTCAARQHILGCIVQRFELCTGGVH